MNQPRILNIPVPNDAATIALVSPGGVLKEAET